jgi:predicted ABC-type ATPase
MKDIVLLGGPNGAGKTTAARNLMPEILGLREFLNADEIAREISPGDPDAVAFTAGRMLLDRMRQLIAAGRSFAFETTCSGRSYIPILRRCRENGWRITFYYLWLPRPEDCVARVARRVSQGGHRIPTETIVRRFRTGLWNAINLYLPLADQAEVYDNSDGQPILIAQKDENSPLSVVDPARWARMREVAEWRK